MHNLFFELIRFSIGTQSSLSRMPSAKEWEQLYAMAQKQSLIGICFAGVKKLCNFEEEYYAGMNEMLYLTWMGMTAKIQQRNETVNQQCVILGERLEADGLRYAILKGQGVAQLYGSLALLRQSGDIDVWVLPEDNDSENEHFRKVMTYVREIAGTTDFNRQHVQLPVFEDTEVEVHFMPSRMNNPWMNKRLQRWFREKVKGERLKGELAFTVPSSEFNLIYLLQHCYNHLLFEGVGLRQVMDYFWALSRSRFKGDDFAKTLYSLGLMKFASAMMYVMGEVFHLDEQCMICKPNEEDGRFLLNELMSGGNFGKYGKDGVMEGHADGKLAFFLARMRRNLRFMTHYPSEILWSPYAMISHYVWKNKMKRNFL